MAYQLGQYNHLSSIDDYNDFLTLVEHSEARQKSSNTELEMDSGMEFTNNCVTLTNDETFVLYNHYYFHGKIKKLNTEQRFYVKLVNYEDSTGLEQYIKTFVVPPRIVRPGESESLYGEWVDIEFMFSPIATFDSILFELQRISQDYIDPRVPIIGYQEISLINDIITNSRMININSELIKLGMQSRPGLMMCINGEEIHTPRSGIYELKNGVILVNFFSVIAPAAEMGTQMKEWMDNPVASRSFTMTPKLRTVDGFTVDYMYKVS